MREIKRVSAGVKFESDVLRFVDLLAAEHQRSRSFIINQILRAYARTVQQQRQVEVVEKPPAPLSAISF